MKNTSLEEVLKLAFNQQMSGRYTAIPCVITNIPDSLNDLKVDVQPIINQLHEDGTSEEQSQILGVPVIFPSGRETMLSFPLYVGDTVLCIFSQANIDNFKQGSGQLEAPDDHRAMDREDAIAIPGLVPFSKSLNRSSGVRAWPHNTRDTVIAHNIASGQEVEIRMKPTGDIIINTNQNATVNCNNATVNADTKFEVNAPSCIFNATTFTVNASSYSMNASGTASWTSGGATNWSGTVNHTGSFTFNGIPFETHKHTGVQAGGDTSGGPTS